MTTNNEITFSDHIVAHPYRYKRVPIPGATDLFDMIPTWVDNPNEIVQLGTAVDRQLFEKLRGNVTRRSQVYTATANQTVFNLTKAYLVGQGRLDVYISGVKQRSGIDFTETSPTSFTLSEGLEAGTIVEAVYFSASQALSEDLIEQVQAAEAATLAANEAADDANDAATGALTANLNWKEPVNNLTALNALASPQTRDTRQTKDTGNVYRYDGTAWVLIQTMDPNAINALDTRLTTQLADIANTDESTYTGILGAEIVDGTGWSVPAGWTGDFITGYVNTPGNTSVLSRAMPATGTKLYQVAFRVESPTPAGIPNASTDFAVKIGNSVPFVTYQGGGNFDYTFGIRSVSDGPLEFVPGLTFNGTIKNVSVKEISGELAPMRKVADALGNIFIEERTAAPSLENVFLGKGSGRVNTTGRSNVAVGSSALKNNTTGYWNSALGRFALEQNTTGSRNIALGYLALNENISGDRNIAIGTYTLQRNTHGRQNIALGADALWVNTTGSRNIVLGMGGMGENVSGNENIAIGYVTLEHNIDGSNNIALGQEALLRAEHNSNQIAIGREALKNSNPTDINGINIAIGFAALANTTTGVSNTALGRSALFANTSGSENVAFGHYAVSIGAPAAISQTVALGAWAGSKLTTGGNNNTLIGYGAGRELTSGNNNILIGRNVDGSSPTASGEVNIGNVFKSNIFTKRTTLGDGITNPTARLHLPAQTAAAQSAPIKLTTGDLMTTPEAGAIEYSNNKLYFTIGSGVRREIAFV